MGTIKQFLTALCPLNLKKIPVICLLLIISAKVEQSNFPYHRQNISNESYNHYKDLYSAFLRNICCPGTLGKLNLFDACLSFRFSNSRTIGLTKPTCTRHSWVKWIQDCELCYIDSNLIICSICNLGGWQEPQWE